jgi:glycosyltransferase involved in cell wall biosynthesis
LSEVTGNVQFDIYGPIEDEEYWDKCQQEIAIMPDNIQVNYCGLVGHEDVHKTFANYDAFFFPTLSENFGHVIVEALMVGCPVIISDQTPWNDINDYNCGGSFSLEKPKMFVDMVQSIVSADDNNMETYRENIKVYVDRKLKVQDIKKQYHKVLLEIL